MLRATHVASVSRQDCRALFAKLSDVEHQLEPCDDGRRAAVRLKRDSNTVPKCPRGCWARGAPGLKGPWVVGGDVGDGAVRAGAHEGDAWRGAGCGLVHPRVLTAWEAGSVWLGPHAAAPLLTRAFSIPSRARACLDCRGGEAKHAGRVDGGGRGGEGGPRRRGRGDGGGARVWTATRAARSARVGRRRGGR